MAIVSHGQTGILTSGASCALSCACERVEKEKIEALKRLIKDEFGERRSLWWWDTSNVRASAIKGVPWLRRRGIRLRV
ncbi:hypothetical protein L226DRAFT_225582 [Lentinus tigrinus ALCF2SS1-7]|uniref:uncharacterized protein n=1 Tax=Lentinus tigrinus ALCF2SS1-7 TaxID=1328758 RepID=UPI0011661B06|nr:hypothetical protein L226DRAFT_225582 [Lentinus tigrinus ALCF2SS1-7]